MTSATKVRLEFLEKITNGFSVNSIIGRGGYGDVYKGVLPNGEVTAVKLLHDDPVHILDDEKFNNEVVNLLGVEHPNIVRLCGYCYETQHEYIEHNGKMLLRQRIYRILCFEYLQNGSLDRHLHARSFAPDWSTRYNIIKGICEGLNFLHGCKPQICHLDLKPSNILLDSSMLPKVSDFGLSRVLDPSHTNITNNIIGTKKYMPPEFFNGGIISDKNDVFSLGVLIREIIAGQMSPSHSSGMADLTQFMPEVLKNWSTKIEATSTYPSDEKLQVQTCIELAIRCMDSKSDNRPSTMDILAALNKTEINIPMRQSCPQISVPRLEDTAKERTHFTSMQENVACPHEVSEHRETTASLKVQVVGREKEKQEIMARLSGSTTQEITFLQIYGIGGIGKSTMAQLVFNDSQFKEYSRVWIYVSPTFDLKIIGNSIITQLSNRKSKHTELQMIENSLKELLSSKRVLIILDDLWESSPQLRRLASMLNLGEGGKVVVVVTTREESIAQKIHKDTVKYKLAPLTDEICWTIIKNKCSFETRAERAQLELIGKAIANKCGGLALAAQSIGYMLEKMEFNEWVSVNNSEIWDVLALGESSPDHVHASLKLSYRSMDKYLKLCFAYCGTFPKGHKIAKEDLAHQWIALGLVPPSRTFSNIQTSHNYIRQLLGMSFLERSWSQWTMDVDNFLIMHDLVHDLARSVLADAINIESQACRYAWLIDHRKLFKSSMITALGNIRALHIFDHGYPQIHGDLLSRVECLRILDLSRCCAQELPDSIGHLKQLRYLDASWDFDFTVSSKFQAPPESILIPKTLGSLNKLQYLNLSNRRRPVGLPEVISKLTELRYLNISRCGGYYLLDNPLANQSFIECIGTLPNLEQLDMSWNDYGFCVPESFSSLKKLNLHGCNRISSIPENVLKVDIPSLFGLLDERPELNMFDIDLSGFPVRAVASESSSSLVWLKHTNPDVLAISDLGNVKSVEEAQSISLTKKHKIQKLSLAWERGVSSVEPLKLLTELVPPSSVKKFEIIAYNGVILPHWFMHISKYLPNLVSLVLWGLTCRSIPTLVQLPNLRKIVLGCMSNLKELNTSCSTGEDGANEATLPQLEYLEIYQCKNLRIKPSPPRAVYWKICGSDNVLSSWGECASSKVASSSSTAVSKLTVEHPALPLCQWRLLHHLHGLSDLTIDYCNDLTISPQITRAFSSLKSLSLGIHGLKKLPEWLGELTSLRRLNLERYYGLVEFHENMRQLTQLQSLSLDKCGMLTSLPQWLGEVTLLKTLKISSCEGMICLPDSIVTNLQELHIFNCPKLYEWFKLEENQLKLAYIKEKIVECPDLNDWCLENLSELAQINGLVLRISADADEDAASSEASMDIEETIAIWKKIEVTIDLPNMKDVGDSSAASIDAAVTHEPHPDLYSAVMNMPGFTEEALLVAVSHLMDYIAQGSAYMGMQEEDRVSWLMNFLKRHY